jgi:hypothetical protein
MIDQQEQPAFKRQIILAWISDFPRTPTKKTSKGQGPRHATSTKRKVIVKRTKSPHQDLHQRVDGLQQREDEIMDEH